MTYIILHNSPVYQLKQFTDRFLKKNWEWSLTNHILVQPQSISFLLFQTENFHFTDIKVSISGQKRVSILTGWALVRAVQAYITIVRIWCIGNIKIMISSKCWPIATTAIDSISFIHSYQRHLCWYQTAWVYKTEQEWACRSFPISRT